MDIKGRSGSVTDRGTWAARGASFMSKVKATKVVWFPPKPVEGGKTATSSAKKAAKEGTNRATKKTTAAAKKATNSTKKS